MDVETMDSQVFESIPLGREYIPPGPVPSHFDVNEPPPLTASPAPRLRISSFLSEEISRVDLSLQEGLFLLLKKQHDLYRGLWALPPGRLLSQMPACIWIRC